jgi:L,D-peptidoglycan transpeptidase YkuD (ErfK/YbiS/YcfS/YnhG family)
MRMRHIIICGLRGSAIFFHIISNGTIFEEK